jgi:hypothetical protein
LLIQGASVLQPTEVIIMSTYKGVPVEPAILGEMMELRERLASMAENAANIRAMLNDEIKLSSDLKQEVLELEEDLRTNERIHNAQLLERDTLLLNARARHAVLTGRNTVLLVLDIILTGILLWVSI